MATSTLRDTLYDKLDDIQKQIDEMKEQINYSINDVKSYQTTVDNIVARVSKIEQENKPTSNARVMPDSEGFWRDSDGDVWVRDAAGVTLLIAKGHKEGTNEIYDLPSGPDGMIREYWPYVKIDNPFIQGENHAE